MWRWLHAPVCLKFRWNLISDTQRALPSRTGEGKFPRRWHFVQWDLQLGGRWSRTESFSMFRHNSLDKSSYINSRSNPYQCWREKGPLTYISQLVQTFNNWQAIVGDKYKELRESGKIYFSLVHSRFCVGYDLHNEINPFDQTFWLGRLA